MPPKTLKGSLHLSKCCLTEELVCTPVNCVFPNMPGHTFFQSGKTHHFCIYIYTCVYTYIYIYICIYTYTYIYVSMYIILYIYLSLSLSIYLSLSLSIYIYIYIYIRTRTYTCQEGLQHQLQHLRRDLLGWGAAFGHVGRARRCAMLRHIILVC